MRLIQDLTNDRLVIEDDNKEPISWEGLFISLHDVYELMQGKCSGLCMDEEEDRAQFVACALDHCFRDDPEVLAELKEREEMQEVPDDAIILTEDEARAMLASALGNQFDSDDFNAAVTALDEQLEYEDTEED